MVDYPNDAEARQMAQSAQGLAAGAANTLASPKLLQASAPVRYGPIANLMRSLATGVSQNLCVLGDSTGNELDEWVYRLGQIIGEALPPVRVQYALFDAGAGGYPDFSILSTGGGAGEPHILFAAGGKPRCLAYDEVVAGTGDLTVKVKAALDNWNTGVEQTLIAHFNSGTNRAWRVYISTTGRLAFQWSVDGTNVVTSLASTSALGFSAGVTKWLRFSMDVDNGSGGYTWQMASSDDDVTYTTIGSGATSSGTTSFYAATGDYEIGGHGRSISNIAAGKFYRAEIKRAYYNVTARIANPQPIETWRKYNSADVSDVIGEPTLTIYNASISGMGLNYFTTETSMALGLPNAYPGLVILSTSHNDGVDYGPPWLAKWDTLLTNVRARAPMLGVAALRQNPRKSPATFVDDHARRMGLLPIWCERNDVDLIDGWSAFFDANGALISSYINSDGIHPDTVTYSLTGLTGREALTQAVAKRFLAFA